MVRIRIPGGVVPTAQARGAGPAGRPARRGLAAPDDPPEHRAALGARPATCPPCSTSSPARPVDALGVRAHGAQRDGVGGRRRRPRRAVRLPARRPHDLRCLDRPLGRAERQRCPSRLNIALGGSPRCRHDALVNDIGLVSRRRGRRGRLRDVGRRQPRQGAVSWPSCSAPFVARADVLAAVEAVVDVFVDPRRLRRAGEGPPQVRASTRLGADALPRRMAGRVRRRPRRGRTRRAAVELRRRGRPGRDPRREPAGRLVASACGRSAVPALASVTIDIPLGDISSSEMELFCDLADRYADGFLTLTRDQDVTLRNVALRGVDAIRRAIGRAGPVPARRGAATPRCGRAPARRSARSGSPTRPAPGATCRSATRCSATRRCGSTSRAARTPAPSTRSPTSAWPARRCASPAGPSTATRCTSAPTSTATSSARWSAASPRSTSARRSTRSSAPGRRCATTARSSAARPGGSASTRSPTR